MPGALAKKDAPEKPMMREFDWKKSVGEGADLARTSNQDFAKSWQAMAPGMDKTEASRIQATLDPRQLAMEQTTSETAASLQKTGATAAMGDFQKYMRSQGMQVASSVGGSPLTGGFAQSIATKLGMMQTLQNQMQGENLASRLGQTLEARSRLSMMPANALYQQGLLSADTVSQLGFKGGSDNNDIFNQNQQIAFMNEQGKDKSKMWQRGINFGMGAVGTAVGAYFGGPMGAAAGAKLGGTLGSGITGTTRGTETFDAISSSGLGGMGNSFNPSSMFGGGASSGGGSMASMFTGGGSAAPMSNAPWSSGYNPLQQSTSSFNMTETPAMNMMSTSGTSGNNLPLWVRSANMDATGQTQMINQ